MPPKFRLLSHLLLNLSLLPSSSSFSSMSASSGSGSDSYSDSDSSPVRMNSRGAQRKIRRAKHPIERKDWVIPTQSLPPGAPLRLSLPVDVHLINRLEHDSSFLNHLSANLINWNSVGPVRFVLAFSYVSVVDQIVPPEYRLGSLSSRRNNFYISLIAAIVQSNQLPTISPNPTIPADLFNLALLVRAAGGYAKVNYYRLWPRIGIFLRWNSVSPLLIRQWYSDWILPFVGPIHLTAEATLRRNEAAACQAPAMIRNHWSDCEHARLLELLDHPSN